MRNQAILERFLSTDAPETVKSFVRPYVLSAIPDNRDVNLPVRVFMEAFYPDILMMPHISAKRAIVEYWDSIRPNPIICEDVTRLYEIIGKNIPEDGDIFRDLDDIPAQDICAEVIYLIRRIKLDLPVKSYILSRRYERYVDKIVPHTRKHFGADRFLVLERIRGNVENVI